jgi:hypothetical protein
MLVRVTRALKAYLLPGIHGIQFNTPVQSNSPAIVICFVPLYIQPKLFPFTIFTTMLRVPHSKDMVAMSQITNKNNTTGMRVATISGINLN